MLETAGIAKSHLEGRTVGSGPSAVWGSQNRPKPLYAQIRESEALSASTGPVGMVGGGATPPSAPMPMRSPCRS
jgi:hypothetical protein